MQATLDRIDSPEGFILDPSLVLYLPLYRLDGASFMSKDAYGHLCTVTGALWTPQGRIFNGDDYIDCGNDASLTHTKITIKAWIKTLSAARQIIVSKFDANTGDWGYVFRVNETTGVVQWQLTDYSADTLTSNSAVNDGNWHEVTVTSDQINLQIFIDGVIDNTKACATAIGDSAFSVLVGAWWNAANKAYYFIGTIGEVMVYCRALTPLEIQRNYLATKWRYK